MIKIGDTFIAYDETWMVESLGYRIRSESGRICLVDAAFILRHMGFNSPHIDRIVEMIKENERLTCLEDSLKTLINNEV